MRRLQNLSWLIFGVSALMLCMGIAVLLVNMPWLTGAAAHSLQQLGTEMASLQDAEALRQLCTPFLRAFEANQDRELWMARLMAWMPTALGLLASILAGLRIIAARRQLKKVALYDTDQLYDVRYGYLFFGLCVAFFIASFIPLVIDLILLQTATIKIIKGVAERLPELSEFVKLQGFCVAMTEALRETQRTTTPFSVLFSVPVLFSSLCFMGIAGCSAYFCAESAASARKKQANGYGTRALNWLFAKEEIQHSTAFRAHGHPLRPRLWPIFWLLYVPAPFVLYGLFVGSTYMFSKIKIFSILLPVFSIHLLFFSLLSWFCYMFFSLAVWKNAHHVTRRVWMWAARATVVLALIAYFAPLVFGYFTAVHLVFGS